MNAHSNPQRVFVPETRIGFWFLGTWLWEARVVRVALRDLGRLIPNRRDSYPVVLDAGCGQGKSLLPLYRMFAPKRIIAVDFEDECLERTRAEAAKHNLPADIHQGDVSDLELADASVDLVFCHQTFHHLVHQEKALQEFYRVLKPGGVLLFAESTRAYINSWMIRLFFRHPMEVQRTADEYMQMIRDHGFRFRPENVSLPYLWWSRSDLGALEWFGFPIGKPGEREETLVNLAAVKPER